MKAAAVVTAGGLGTRLGSPRPKQFLRLGGVPMLVWSLRAMAEALREAPVALAVPPGWEKPAARLLARHGLSSVLPPVTGGRRRQDSVRAAFLALPPAEVVVIHDAARPFVSPDLVRACLRQAAAHGAAIAALQPAETVKESGDGRTVARTIDRRRLWLAQTPQAFRGEVLAAAYARADFSAEFTDEAALVEAAGFPVRIVPGEPQNVKITSAADLAAARGRRRRDGVPPRAPHGR